jgi:DNA-binding transcriptional LysR family regulator
MVLLAVAETGSFRRAAIRLRIGQPAVTRRIQKLEDATGVSLFERRRSGAALTSAGTHFIARVRAIIDDIDAALVATHSAGIADTGHLRIGLIASLSHGALRQVVAQFIGRHPEVDLCFAEAERSELLTLLSHRTIDIVVAAGEPSPDIGESLLLVRERIYLAVCGEDPLAARERLSWDDVAESKFVVSAREPGPEIHDYIVRRVSDLGRRARVERHRLGREGIMNLVGLGLGVSLVADHSGASVSANSITAASAARPPRPKAISRRIWAGPARIVSRGTCARWSAHSRRHSRGSGRGSRAPAPRPRRCERPRAPGRGSGRRRRR